MRKIYNALKVFVTRKLVIEFDKMEFTYTHLSHKRYFNWVFAELSSILKTRKAYAYPTHLQLEPTNNCNLSCPLCNVVTDKNRKKGVLRFDDFKKLWGKRDTIFSPVDGKSYQKDDGVGIITQQFICFSNKIIQTLVWNNFAIELNPKQFFPLMIT